MQISSMPLRSLIFVAVFSFFVGNSFGQKALSQAPLPRQQPDLVDLSLGYNYIHLDETAPEEKNLNGVDVSAFVNVTSWLGLGGDFMADFGSRDQQITSRRSATIDSQRYLYLFGPRVTVWRDPKFRAFVEALGGGVHAKAEFSFASFNQHASEDAFAMAFGGGFDWRFSDHLSWRIIQADYLPTNLSDQWQSNFRASTAIVYSFGRK
jgi:Outer membrane protein beta-barrel domain